MSIETWLPIPGYEEYYGVSDQGRVRSLDRIVEHRNRWGGINRRPVNGGMLSLDVVANGYRVVGLHRPGDKPRMDAIHRLVMLAFVGPRQDGMEVCHTDGNRMNNTLSNLRYGTHSENAQDIIRHGKNQKLNNTHCPSGHLYSGENLRIDPATGARRCRICIRANDRAYRKRKSEAKT